MSRSIRLAAAFAIGTAAVTLAAFRPSTTFADPTTPLATADGTRFGDVLVSGELRAAPGSRTGWVIVVTARNDARRAAAVDVETCVERMTVNPVARTAGPVPLMPVYEAAQHLSVPASGTLRVVRDVPASVAAGLTAAAAAHDAARPTLAVPAVITTYYLAFRPKPPPGAPSFG